jgi:hypothetical protein
VEDRIALQNKEDQIALESEFDSPSKKGRVLAAFRSAVLPNRLLLSLISSSAFKAYYNMLRPLFKTAFLPKYDQRTVYRLFKTSALSTLSAETDEQEQEQEQEEEEGEEGEEEEAEAEADVNASSESFFKFLKTLVIHFSAKRALETHSLRVKTENINLSLFSVERSALVIPAGSWSSMEAMIREVFSSNPSSTSIGVTAKEAIEILEGKVLKKQDLDDSTKYGRLLKEFQFFIGNNGQILLTGGLHCETVLATLGMYFKSWNFVDNSTNLTSICEVRLLFTCLLILSEHLSLETT